MLFVSSSAKITLENRNLRKILIAFACYDRARSSLVAFFRANLRSESNETRLYSTKRTIPCRSFYLQQKHQQQRRQQEYKIQKKNSSHNANEMLMLNKSQWWITLFGGPCFEKEKRLCALSVNVNACAFAAIICHMFCTQLDIFRTKGNFSNLINIANKEHYLFFYYYLI